MHCCMSRHCVQSAGNHKPCPMIATCGLPDGWTDPSMYALGAWGGSPVIASGDGSPPMQWGPWMASASRWIVMPFQDSRPACSAM
eukprot:3579275-Alexandrium_andersonii.AAC.2